MVEVELRPWLSSESTRYEEVPSGNCFISQCGCQVDNVFKRVEDLAPLGRVKQLS